MQYVNGSVVYMVTMFWLTLIQGLPLTMEAYCVAITSAIAVLSSRLLVSNLVTWTLVYVVISGLSPEDALRFKEITCIAFGVGGA